MSCGWRRVSTPERYAPYELEVLPQAPALGTYFTVTPTGVTQYAKGQASEMTPMADWLRERELFSLLRSIPFFNQYILRRAYNAWKAARPLPSCCLRAHAHHGCCLPSRSRCCCWSPRVAVSRLGRVPGPRKGQGAQSCASAADHQAAAF